jgi:hypothetical protein
VKEGFHEISKFKEYSFGRNHPLSFFILNLIENIEGKY